MAEISWRCMFFTDLTTSELYQIMSLRNEVFVVEQNCVFQDADNKDQRCFHLTGFINDELAAYVRLVPPGVAYNYMSVGRVATSPAHRGHGIGKALMQRAINQCYMVFEKAPIKIGAQLYLKKFYESFGFKQSSTEYIEDGIPHIEMLLEP